MQKGMQTVQRFSIRKCAVGASSVLLGMFLIAGQVSADETTTVSEVTSSLATQVTTAETTATTISSEAKTTKPETVVTVKSVETKERTPAIVSQGGNTSKSIPAESIITKSAPKPATTAKTSKPTVTSSSVTTQNVQQTVAPKLNYSAIIGDDYPAYLKNAAPDSLIDPWRLYNRECVSFVAYRLSSVNGFTIPGAYGNADAWGPRAKREGYAVNKTPAVGSVAWWSGCHVAWVAAVSGDSVTIEEYNYGYNHRYNRRTINISEVEGFIHFKDVTGPVTATPQPTATSIKQSSLATSGTYVFSKKSIIRAEAKQSSPELAHYEAGQSVHYDKVVESDGYRWISYLSYAGNRRYIAVEALTVPTTGNLKIANQNNSTGTFDVVISNVGHTNLKEVLLPVWSENAGQDDIIWYKATKQESGTYKVTVDAAKHKNDRGVYHAHLYYQANDSKKTYVTKATANLPTTATNQTPSPTTGTITITNKNDSKGSFDIIVSNVSHTNLKEVQVPVWSETGGQDDLVWYKPAKQADGTYKVTINASSHKNSRGLYHAHLYYQPVEGQRFYVSDSAKTVTLAPRITLPASGVYTFTKSSPVKGEAKSTSTTLATYSKGQTVTYDKVLIAEGKQWISYISYSGARRYVQVD